MGPQLFGIDVAVIFSIALVAQAADRPAFVPKELLDRIDELAKTAPPPAPRLGEHSIHGRVVTDEGTPLEGVGVRVTWADEPIWSPDRAPFEDSSPPADTLARSLGWSANWWYRRRPSFSETTTAADGRFVLDHLAEGRFEVQAWRKGYFVEPAVGGSYGRLVVVTESTVGLVAHPLVAKRVVLRLPDGSSPERAQLDLQRHGVRYGGVQGTWTRESPSIRLPAGDWLITAQVDGDTPKVHSIDDAWFSSRPTLVTATPKAEGSAEDEPVVIELHGNPGIEGTISESTGGQPSGVNVKAARLEAGEKPDDAFLLLRSDSPRDRRVESSQNLMGSDRGLAYRISRIDPGRWLVGVVDWQEQKALTSAVVEVGAGVVLHDFTLPARDPDAGVRVTVLDPDGALVRDCAFEYHETFTEPDGRKNSRGGELTVRRTLDGAFRFDRSSLGEEYRLFVENPRFGVRIARVPTGARDLEVRFEAPAVPTLRLVGFGEHAAGRRVAVEVDPAGPVDPGGQPRWPRFEPTAIAADGTVALGRLQPGRWRIRVVCKPDARTGRSDFAVASATIDLGPGPREISLPFPELTTLTIALKAGVRESLMLASIDVPYLEDEGVARDVYSDATGTITFTDLPPGLYELYASGGRSMVVEVPSSKTIAFVPEAVNAQRIVITDPKGRLESAGLRSGDFIVAIDGQEFATRDVLDRIQKSLQGPDVTLTVVRGEKFFEVVLERTLLKDEKAAGGRFRDASR